MYTSEKPALPSPFTPEELARYAELAVGRCLDLRPGETLLLVSEPEHRPLAVALAEAAYRRGLRVATSVRDPLVERAELDHADESILGALLPWQRALMLTRTEEGAAGLYVTGDGRPGALDGCDAGRLALRSRRAAEQLPELYERIRENRDSFLIIGYPTPAWAERVYPDRAPEAAQRALAEDLLRFARIGPEDGEGDSALAGHIATLRERARIANRLQLRELRFRGPGTDLRIGLTEDAVWNCAGETNAYGRTILANLPSEEIFTSPAASATEGTVRCTLPLSWRGRLYEDLRAEFRGGRLVRLEARTEDQRDALLGQLDVDEGGRRLGEVALVDASSRIGQAGRMYWNTLFDENQASHIAFGFGFASCRARPDGETEDLNHSRTHIDVMIGSPEVEVTGRTASGQSVPLIAGGIWRAA